MEYDGIWQARYTIDSGVIDLQGRLRMPHLCNYLQVAASAHAEYHQLGFHEMQAMGKYWVLNRLHVEMKDWPRWGDTIEVRTWVHKMKGPFSYRNFSIYDAQGTLMGAATTLWVAVDAARGRLARISPKGLPILNTVLPLCPDPIKLDAIPLSAVPYTYRVAYSDLDLLRHVNNAKYIEWLFNSYPLAQHASAPQCLMANYLQETHHDDEVQIHTDASTAPTMAHEVTRTDGTPLLRARIMW